MPAILASARRRFAPVHILNGRFTPYVFAVLILASSIHGWTQSRTNARGQSVVFRITLSQLDLHVPYPAPKLRFTLRALDGSSHEQRITTNAGGVAEVKLPSGRYQLTSVEPAHFNGRWYAWDLELPLTIPENFVELNATNATVLDTPPGNDEVEVAAQGPSSSTAPLPNRNAAETRDAGGGSGETPTPQGRRTAADTPSQELKPSAVHEIGEGSQPRAKRRTQTSATQGTQPPPAIAQRPATPSPTVVASASIPPLTREIKPSQVIEEEPEIMRVIQRWVDSAKARDLEAQMSCYAPQLERYFRKTNVPWEEVKRDKQRFFNRYSEMRELGISNVELAKTGDRVEARLIKSWDFRGVNTFRGQVAAHLIFDKIDGRWVISAERERLIWKKVS